MKEVTCYKCEHCDKVVQTKAYMKKHEAKCFFNTETRSCITCAHFKQDIYEPQGKVRWCDKSIDLTEGLNSNCSMHLSVEALTGSERF